MSIRDNSTYTPLLHNYHVSRVFLVFTRSSYGLDILRAPVKAPPPQSASTIRWFVRASAFMTLTNRVALNLA